MVAKMLRRDTKTALQLHLQAHGGLWRKVLGPCRPGATHRIRAITRGSAGIEPRPREGSAFFGSGDQ
jgi:hypothetical protein